MAAPAAPPLEELLATAVAAVDTVRAEMGTPGGQFNPLRDGIRTALAAISEVTTHRDVQPPGLDQMVDQLEGALQVEAFGVLQTRATTVAMQREAVDINFSINTLSRRILRMSLQQARRVAADAAYDARFANPEGRPPQRKQIVAAERLKPGTGDKFAGDGAEDPYKWIRILENTFTAANVRADIPLNDEERVSYARSLFTGVAVDKVHVQLQDPANAGVTTNWEQFKALMLSPKLFSKTDR